MNHIVQKQMITLSVPSLKSGHEWEGKLQYLLRDIINPNIEKYFDKVSSGETNTIIDYLEINLGTLNQLSPQQLTDKVISALSQQLKLVNNNLLSAKHDNHTDHNVNKETSTGGNIERELFQEISHHKKNLICFLNFLTYGTLPWWVEHDKIELQGDWIQQLSQAEVDLIVQRISQHPHALHRLVLQFNVEFLIKLIHHYLPNEATSILQGWKWFANHYTYKADNGHLHSTYWRYWLTKGMKLREDRDELVQAVAQWIASTPKLKDEVVMILFNHLDDGGKPSQHINQHKFIPALVRTILSHVFHNDVKLKTWLLSDKKGWMSTNPAPAE